MDNTKSRPLAGVRVIDLTRVLAVPFASMILADLGAEVIKIERPVSGDDSRQFGPFIHGESSYFMSINRNKYSITLDLKKDEGKEIFFKLVKNADILVENFRPGTMYSLGMDYEKVKSVNPRIVYASISGFGHTGPYSERPAYDGIVQAMGGIMGITGEAGGRPVRVGSSIGDIIAGLFGASGILAAYIKAKETGTGQFVDVAMLDSQVAILENAISRYQVTGSVPKAMGSMHPSIFPFQTFETETDEIMIACGNDSIWVRLCKALDIPEAANDPLFCSNKSRGENYEQMVKLLLNKLIKKPALEWVAIFDKEGVPSTTVNSIDQVIKNPQICARNMIIGVDHPIAGKVPIIGMPIKISGMEDSIDKAAPVLGADNNEILSRLLGMSKEEISRLIKDSVI